MPAKNTGKNRAVSTQRYLDITEIKDNCVILKDGTLRAVLMVSSINFSLKGEEEQAAIIQSYVQFLNALDFNLQIVIQSRKLNIDNYLERIKKVEKSRPMNYCGCRRWNTANTFRSWWKWRIL